MLIRSKSLIVLSILVTLLLWRGQASAGWVIEQAVKGMGEGSRQHMMLQSNRMKTLTLEDGVPTFAFIWDLNAETMLQVDYERRQYAVATVQEYVQMIQGMMTGAMKEMQEAMKDVSPEQRKMFEEMVRSQMGQKQDCKAPKIEVRKTGQQAKIAGYQAVRFDILTDGKMESELWVSKDITAWRELDPKKLERFAAEMEKLAGCGAKKGGFQSDPSWKLVGEGYPVKTVGHGSAGGLTVEVVKAEKRDIPMTEFQPPAGLTRKTFKEIMGQ